MKPRVNRGHPSISPPYSSSQNMGVLKIPRGLRQLSGHRRFKSITINLSLKNKPYGAYRSHRTYMTYEAPTVSHWHKSTPAITIL